MDQVSAFYYQSLFIASIATVYSVYCGIQYYRNQNTGKKLKFIIATFIAIAFWGLFISMSTGIIKPRIFDKDGELIDKIQP
jgi:hypothetical protein